MVSPEFDFIRGLTADLSSKELIFPTSLNATMKIRKALSNNDSAVEQIARIIGTEPVLSAHILRLANSAAFNRGNQRTADLQQATTRLGLVKVRNVAIWIGMKQLTVSVGKGDMTHLVDGLWKRTLRIAATSFVIARRFSSLSPDSAMLAGLLHDIGKFYILYRASKYAELFNDEMALWEIVDRWHQDIGASILENWEVDEEIRSAVLSYRDIDRNDKSPPDLADVLTAADILDRNARSDISEQAKLDLTLRAFSVLEMDSEDCEMLLADAQEQTAMLADALL
jgi:HD-like signal output (HDOD) protein